MHAQFGCWFQSYPALLGIPKLKEHVLQIKHCIYLCNSFPAAPASHLWPRNLSVFSVHSEGHFAAPGHMMASNLPKGLEPKQTSRGKYGSHWLVLAGSWQKNKHHKDFVEIFVASVRVCQWETCIPAFHGNMFRSIAIEGCMGLWHVSG